MTETHKDIITLTEYLKQTDRELFILFVQDRIALTESLGQEAAEDELAMDYALEIAEAKKQ